MRTIGPDAEVAPRARWWRTRRPRPRVRLGAGVRIGRDVVLRADPGALLLVADGVAIGDGARVHARGGLLRIGPGAQLAQHASLADTVQVGAESVVGPWARAEGDAVLGPRARLAAHAVALRGARVGAAELVPAYAVVERVSRSAS
jgi:carbonic anhydrase/acetyltransferase-like protein (isoleucine patch superfamily)